MLNQNTSSDSHQEQPPLEPPSTTTVGPVDPEIIQAVVRAVAPFRSGEHEKALNFIKESIYCHPRSGQLHYTEGKIHLRLAYQAALEDHAACVKHLEDGVQSALLAVELLPNSLHCASLLVDFLYELALANKDWERVEEAIDRGLAIEDPVDFGIRDLLGDDSYNRSRIEKDMKWLEEVETPEIFLDKDRETDRKKKQIMKQLKDNIENILKYKRFWSSTLMNQKRRGFQKVNLEDLKNHSRSLKHKLAVDLLLEAIEFAKQHKTWKFRECCACVKKFGDYDSYRKHLWEAHWMGCTSYWRIGEGLMNESIDMVVNGVWKPANSLDECEISTVEEVPGKNSRSHGNESSKTSMHVPKWGFCDDIERSKILGSIRSIFLLLQKNKCFTPIHVRWAIDYTESQFESKVPLPLSQYLNLGTKSLQIIYFLDASQLTELLTFFKDVAHTCGLSENVEMDNSVDDDKIRDHLVFDIKERVLFSRDLSCFLLDERVLQGVLNARNYFDAVAGDDSAASFSPNECEDGVVHVSDDSVSWLYMGSNCDDALESWSILRESRRKQAKKSHGVFLEKLSVLPKLCARDEEKASKLMAVQVVEGKLLEKTKKREKISEHEPQLYTDLLQLFPKDLEGIKDWFTKLQLDVISEILKEAEVPSRDHSGFEGCPVDEKSRMQVCAKQRDNCIGKALRRLKMQLVKDLCFHDAVLHQKFVAFHQYEIELTRISVFDYRSIVVPLLKSFLQSRLKDLYKEANEKSKAAEEALLAEIEVEKNINKYSNSVKQYDDKKKNKRKKKPKKVTESEATDDYDKHFELHRKDAEQKNDESLDEPKQLTASSEEPKLNEELENQRQSRNFDIHFGSFSPEDLRRFDKAI